VKLKLRRETRCNELDDASTAVSEKSLGASHHRRINLVSRNRV